ncbi:MATE family efflux transporter [Pontixanthobacter gangjinensis]|uniref:MATE family efflux transporter n=1 Tax=Pontixanthobacter gangjinensis TaxID=1028742 RepID=A0A6I4SNR1_9SPHN|nr:MATE family efflux transporter [Pontixanthobacter gangjinensis]MXO57393.1 MATE family efflux transporter [Pontixanthobacter gangjinensis]
MSLYSEQPQTSNGPLSTGTIWAIALPAMVTNVATAFIGLGDMWIVGRLNDAPMQGAVDIGARLFAVLFIVMNFLKTGTTGLVAQDGTRSGEDAQAVTLLRGLLVGLVIAAALLLLKPLILPSLLGLLGAEGAVLESARTYADIRYWSAPAYLANLALIGFLIGRKQMAAVLLFEVGYNLVNICLGLWFVIGLNLGIAGIGWSSFAAEFLKLVAVLVFVLRGQIGLALLTQLRDRAHYRWQSLRPFLAVNRDLFLRTVLLMVALSALTRLSAERGPVVLAANGIIYQMFVLTALLLDGFENAAQVLNGERYGARDRAGFLFYFKQTLVRGFAVAALVAIGFAGFSGPILESFAATVPVADAAKSSASWLILIPFAGVAGFVLDGVFVGASWTRALLLTMAGAAAIFAISLWLTWPLGNDGLWLSFVIFLVARALLQLVMMPRLIGQSFRTSGTASR